MRLSRLLALSGMMMLVLPMAMALAAPAAPRFVNTEYHYSFVPPAGWTRKTDLPRSMVAFIGPAKQDFAVNFSVTIYSKPVNNKEETQFIKAIKVENGAMYAMKRIRLDGEPAHAWCTHLHLPGHPPLENRQIVCLHNAHAYELTFTMLPSTQQTYDAVWNKILASFRWEK